MLWIFIPDNTCWDFESLRVRVLVGGSSTLSLLVSDCLASLAMAVAVFQHVCSVHLSSALEASVRDFLEDFAALDFVIFPKINEVSFE
jgi:hypothetical protein